MHCFHLFYIMFAVILVAWKLDIKKICIHEKPFELKSNIKNQEWWKKGPQGVGRGSQTVVTTH